jgi:hypothetical protein
VLLILYMSVLLGFDQGALRARLRGPAAIGSHLNNTTSIRLKAPESREHPGDQGKRGSEAGRSNHGFLEP